MKSPVLLALVLQALLYGTSAQNLTASKQVWKIGGLAIRGATDFVIRWSPTFADYLNQEVSPLFNPPLTFESIPLNFSSTFLRVEHGTIDFVFTNPSAFSCLESEFDVSAIVTLRNLRRGIELTKFGGIVFTRENNTEINTIADLRGKIVEAVSISGLGAAQMQWRLLTENGLDLMTDPAQVRFSFNQKKIVHDVRRGDVDVGFVRTDMIETMDANGETSESYFKVINKQNITIDGNAFPFRISTILYPEWSLGALPQVMGEDYRVAEEVAKALMRVNSTMTSALAAGYSTWQAPISYMTLRAMQEALGWIQFNSTSNKWKCMRSDDLYEAIICPSGYYKLKRDVVDAQCGLLGSEYQCPSGYKCLCRPCRKADEVEVVHEGNRSFSCQKMGICASSEQLAKTNLFITDNLERNQNLTYKLHVARGHIVYDTHPKEGTIVPINNQYNLTLATPEMGDNVLELSIAGTQIPNSPILLRVTERTCEEGYQADSQGDCKATVKIIYLPEWFRGLSFFLFLLNVFLALGFMAWTFVSRNHPIVRASQPTFLYLVGIGCIMSSTSILTVGFDDKDYSDDTLDKVCMANIWFYCIGFGLTVSALYSKTYRAKCLMIDKMNAKKARHVVVSIYQYFTYIGAAVALEMIVCLIWSAYDPLEWRRSCASGTEDNFCKSIGKCSSGTGLNFVTAILVLHFVFLCYLLWMCYEVRNIPAEFAEHKWITASAVSSIEIIALVPFLVAITWQETITSTLITTLALFFNDFGVLVMIFVPKIAMMYQKHTEETESQENMLFNMRRKVRLGITSRRNTRNASQFDTNVQSRGGIPSQVVINSTAGPPPSQQALDEKSEVNTSTPQRQSEGRSIELKRI